MISFIEHEDYYKHKMPQLLENPRRLKIIMKALEEKNYFTKPFVKKITPNSVNEKKLLELHTQELIDTVKYASMMGETSIYGDTFTNEFTFNAALRAVGGAIRAAEEVVEVNNSLAYALTRPPGHHATRNMAMGYCFFNNIALAANHLLLKKKVKKIAIIDFDNHYGNGTADLFYNRNDVLYLSLHADPKICFPYQGRVNEIGDEEGEGYNICIPLPLKTGDKEYSQAFEKIVPPIINEYKPEILFISAGYDALENDPYGYLGLSIFGFQYLGEQIMKLAKENCNGKVIMCLEGGYKYEELGEAFIASIIPFSPNYIKDKSIVNKFTSGGNKTALKNTLDELTKILKHYWNLE